MSLIVWLPFTKNINNNGLSSFDITGTPTWTTYSSNVSKSGKFGSAALQLNTRLTWTVPELVGLKTWSVSFWCIINTDATLTGNWVDIFALEDKDSEGSTTGSLRWEACYASGTNVAIGQYDGKIHNNGTTLTTVKDIWHHCLTVVNYELGVVDVYIDGELKFTREHLGGYITGKCWTGQANAVNGAIQDLRIYNHALSKKEIHELNKGMVMHLPLSWGGNPNMIKNSYTWMNKRIGNDNSTGNLASWSKDVSESDTAPCKWVFRCTGVNSNSSASANWIGAYFGLGSQGLTVNDLVENETYTYSFWARINPESTGTTTFRPEAICESQTVLHTTGFGALTTEWRKHTVTFQWTTTSRLTICFYTSFPANSTVTYELCGLKLEKSSKATPYIPNVDEPEYISMNYATKYLQDCSGYNYPVSGYGANNSSCESPKGSSGTNCGSGSCIVLGKTCKIQYPMSFAFWFNTSNLQNNSNRLISCTEGGGWGVELNGNYLCWTTGTGTSSNTYKFCISTKTYTELQGAWHHVACTYDGLKSQIYIDGELSKETTHFTTATPLYYNANNGVFLAAEAGGSATNPGTTYTTETKLADFRMYATVISADDVKELYQVGMQIDKSGNVYCNELVEE